MNIRTPLEFLYQHAIRRPASVALHGAGRDVTYRELAVGIEHVAVALQAAGVRPGDRVVVHMSNRIELVLLVFAGARIGALMVPMGTRLVAAELGSLLVRLQPALYVGEDSRASLLAQVSDTALPHEARYFLDRRESSVAARRWEDLLAAAGTAQLSPPPDPETAWLLFLTSGTTAQPKFVLHTASTLAHAVDSYQTLKSEADLLPVMLGGTPLTHASGLTALLVGMSWGARVVLLPAFEADAVLDAIAANAVSWMIGVPFMYSEMHARQAARPRNLTSLRFCLVAGDVCPRTLQEDVSRSFGAPLHSIWGATEALGVTIHGSPGTVGKRAPNAQLRLIVAPDREAAFGEVGELLVRGPNVTPGYWQAPGICNSVLVAGWLATGDLMRRGPNDDLWFVGRTRDLIIRGGVNIAPPEVEAVLQAHPAVREAGVAGIPDCKLGQRVVAAVSLTKPGETGVLEEILSNTRVRLADYKVPESLRIVTALPRNSQGKLDRAALAQLLAVPCVLPT